MLLRLHACGTSVRDPHIHSRLMKLFGDTCGLKQFVHRIADPSCSVDSVILPSSLIKLLNSKPQMFRRVLGADTARVEQFWTNLQSSAEGRRVCQLHPFVKGKSPADLRFTLPFTLHEDAGPYSKGHSTNLLSWREKYLSRRDEYLSRRDKK